MDWYSFLIGFAVCSLITMVAAFILEIRDMRERIEGVHHDMMEKNENMIANFKILAENTNRSFTDFDRRIKDNVADVYRRIDGMENLKVMQ